LTGSGAAGTRDSWATLVLLALAAFVSHATGSLMSSCSARVSRPDATRSDPQSLRSSPRKLRALRSGTPFAIRNARPTPKIGSGSGGLGGSGGSVLGGSVGGFSPAEGGSSFFCCFKSKSKSTESWGYNHPALLSPGRGWLLNAYMIFSKEVN